VINLKEDDYLSVTLLGRFGGDFGGITYINRLFIRFWTKSSTSGISSYGSDYFGWKQIITLCSTLCKAPYFAFMITISKRRTM
jgi:hypothetical protein